MKQVAIFIVFAVMVGCEKPVDLTEGVPRVQPIVVNDSITVLPGEFKQVGGGSWNTELWDTKLEVDMKVLGEGNPKAEFMVLPVLSAQFRENPVLANVSYRSGEVNQGVFLIQLPRRYTYGLNNASLDTANVVLSLTRIVDPK